MCIKNFDKELQKREEIIKSFEKDWKGKIFHIQEWRINFGKRKCSQIFGLLSV